MSELWTFIIQNFALIRLRDILDIGIVAFVIYICVKFVRETRAVQLIKGIIILVKLHIFALCFLLVSLLKNSLNIFWVPDLKLFKLDLIIFLI